MATAEAIESARKMRRLAWRNGSDQGLKMDRLSPSEVERVELTANFLNSMAAGIVLAATVAPFVGINLGTLKPTTDLLGMLGLSLFGIVVAMVIHLFARRVLLRLG